jgi:uncharacterized repeat protein (TIGR03899 family)
MIDVSKLAEPLAKLTEPITKLIEVIAAGCGQLYEPQQIKRLADAEAYKLLKMAITNSEIQEIEESIADRAQRRRIYQDTKKQINIENISQHAARDLRNEEGISAEPIDEDWTSRFFSIAENITSKEMQRLWGKVLAGEVAKPGSYSLRTLDLLKNINTRDAEILTKAANLTFQHNNSSYILTSDRHHTTDYTLPFTEILILRELGLITEDLALHFKSDSEPTTPVLIYNKKSIIAEKGVGSPQQQLRVIAFTRIGQELLPLIPIEQKPGYTEYLGSLMKTEGTTVKIGDIVHLEANTIHSENLQEI